MRRFRLFSMLAVLLCAVSMWAAPAEAANGKLPDALLASEYANCYNCWRDVYPKAGNECKLWSFLNDDEEDTGNPWKIEDAGLFNPDDDAYNAIWEIVEVMFQQNNISGDAKSEYISNYEDYLDLGEKPILSAKGKELASQVRLHRLYQKQGDTWVPKQLGEQESYGYVIVVGYKSSDKYIALYPTGQDNGFHLLTNMSATDAASYPERESALNITFGGDAFTPEPGGDQTPSDPGKLPEGVDGLVYTGAAQSLVTEGEKDGFTFYYKAGESGEWSTALPAAIPAGTYTVYYKATAEGEEDITGSLDVTIAKADIQLPGAGTVFSTSADSYIQFAPGNLQYQASTGTWRFAEHAWDYIGNAPGNNVYTGRESQSDWIDLFSWATGKNPTYISEDSKDFLPSITEGEFAVSDDWGTAAASYIGEGWRTITYAEWMYLWESRANAANLHAKAQVNGVNGYLLLPDGWTSAGVSVNITGDRGAFRANTLTLEQWETLASQGATFLPAAGFNQYSTEPYYEGQPASEYQYVNQAGTFGYYWMSTAATGDRANVFMFYDSFTYPYTWRDRSMIISVRPVQDAEKPKSETTLPKAIGGLITNGEAQALITAGSSKEGTFLYSLDGENWSETLPTGVEAKDYTVYYKIKGDNNHNDSPVGQLTASIGTLPKAIEGLVYNGEPQTLIKGGEIAGYSFQYKVGEDGEWVSELPAETNAGTYTVYYKASAEGEEDITGSVQATIAKADIDLNGGGDDPVSLTLPKAIEGLVYTGAQQALIEAGESSDGTFLYSIDGENWADTLPKGLDAGDYTVYYKVQGDANHNDSEVGGPLNITIGKADAAFTEPTANELTYTGEPQMSVVPGTSEDGKFQYSPDGENWTDTVPKLKDAGEYSIYYRFVGDENHEDGEEESVINVVIAKAAPEFTAPVANEPTYNEQPQALIAAGTTEDGTMLYSMDGENWSETIPTATNAGEYTVYYKVQGDANHNDSEPESVTVTIAKAAPEFTAPEANEPTYNEQPQALIAAGSTEDGTMLYSMDGENWSTEIPTAIDAGEYTVYYRVIGDDNHNDSEPESVTVTIAKAAPEFIAPVANEPIYNEQPQALIAAGTTEDGTMLYSLDGENWSTEIPTATNAGEYTVYYKVQGDDDHSDSEAESVIVTIAKAEAEFTAPEANEPTYNGQPQALIAAGTTEDGTMLYSLDGENWSTEIPTATNAGAYTVYYKVQGDANHNDSEPESMTVTIAKATLSVSEVEVVKAKFADGNANAQVTIHGVLNGVQGDDAITLTTTAAYDNAEVGDGKTITVSYTLVADATVLANYDFPVTTEVYTTEGVIIEPMVPNNDATPETTDQEVKEGIEVNAYGFCHGENYSLGYHLKSGDPNQYKIEFPDSRFTDVDWTDLIINGASGRDGYIDINVPVDLPTGMYSMTVTFRRYIAFSDGSNISLESAPFTTSFNVNLPETYTMPLFDNVIALVDTCECLTDVQWYHREKSTDEWQLIPGATNYYYKQEGGLTGEYFAKVKMNGVATFTCPQTDVETLYGQGDAAAKQAKVSVYPNPVVSTATVTIEDSDTFDHVLRVVNGNGWQIEQREFEGMETTINLTGCTAGHYMISVDGIVVKVIKK